MENLTSNDPNDPSCVYKHKTPSPAGSEVGTLPLPDLSNIKARPKRQASKNAETTMSKVLKMHAPRGDPSKSTLASSLSYKRSKQNVMIAERVRHFDLYQHVGMT